MKNNKKLLAFKISEKLEKKIATENVRMTVLSKEIGMNSPNVSKNRNMLKRGKMCSLNFLIGITLYFNDFFLEP